ncbi:META domain-containing protein [Hymenobacter rigui]|uniref:META domain-containing protein n=1 Tax=Hymenobacter rigui TaxID=334424 RepID=A0A3R9V1X1_9BACT|nr:META domain-containing protein [Hymenobacter rigui]RSK44915.1 META domain-containing protein [Hymenobacter rigui]
MRYFFPAFLLLTACQTTAPATETTSTPAPATAAPAAELRGTKWLLHSLNGQPVTSADGKEIYLLLSATEAQAEGQAGCNRFRGPVEPAAPNQLRFGPLMATKMACPDLPIENGFMNALNTTRTYRISGDTLRLYAEATTRPSAELHRGQ